MIKVSVIVYRNPLYSAMVDVVAVVTDPAVVSGMIDLDLKKMRSRERSYYEVFETPLITNALYQRSIVQS